MVALHGAKTRVSLLVIVTLGFATGPLASTIAAGRFVGEPGIVQVPGAPRFVSGSPPAGEGAVLILGSGRHLRRRRRGRRTARRNGPAAAAPRLAGRPAFRREPDLQRPCGMAVPPRGGLTGINGVRHPSG
ncbi:MAG: hypothetical protein IPF73_07160 [Betaproteobacteria bacterium]|nr:hypothetical protein [Betaproteobacteria bacterium]